VPSDVSVTWVCTGGLAWVCRYKRAWLFLLASGGLVVLRNVLVAWVCTGGLV
jgi:hypothetical protein